LLAASLANAGPLIPIWRQWFQIMMRLGSRYLQLDFRQKKTDHDQLACFNRTRIGVEIAAETG
jgi:hypothetical protein